MFIFTYFFVSVESSLEKHIMQDCCMGDLCKMKTLTKYCCRTKDCYKRCYPELKTYLPSQVEEESSNRIKTRASRTVKTTDATIYEEEQEEYDNEASEYDNEEDDWSKVDAVLKENPDRFRMRVDESNEFIYV